MQGIYVQSRAQWINEGEEQTRFFLQFRVQKFKPKIQKVDGTIITEQTEILAEAQSVYKNLYSEQKNLAAINLADLVKNENANLQMNMRTNVKVF